MRKKVAGKRHVSSTSPGSSPVKDAANKGNPVHTEVRDLCASSRSASEPHNDVYDSANENMSKTVYVDTVVNEILDNSGKNRNIEGLTGDAREAGKVDDRQAEDEKGVDKRNIETRSSKHAGSLIQAESSLLGNDTVYSANNDSFGNNRSLEESRIPCRDLTGSEQTGASLKSLDTGHQLPVDGFNRLKSTIVDNELDKGASVKVFEGMKYQVRDLTESEQKGASLKSLDKLNQFDKGASVKVFEGMRYHVINTSADLNSHEARVIEAGKTRKSMAESMKNFEDIPEHLTVTNPGTKHALSGFLRKKRFCKSSLPVQTDSNEGKEEVVSGQTNVKTTGKSVLPFYQSSSTNSDETSTAWKLKECEGPRKSGSNESSNDKNNVMTESSNRELNNLSILEKEMRKGQSDHSNKLPYESDDNTDLVIDIPDFKAKNVEETVPSPDSTVTYDGCNMEETTETNSFKIQSDYNGKKINLSIEVENLEIPNKQIGESTNTEVLKDITDGNKGVLTTEDKKSVDNQNNHHEKKSDNLRLAEKAEDQAMPDKEPEKETDGEPSLNIVEAEMIKSRTIQQGGGHEPERTMNDKSADNTSTDAEGELNAGHEETSEPFRVVAVHFDSELPCSPGPDNLLLQNLMSPPRSGFMSLDKTSRTYEVKSPTVNIVTSYHITPTPNKSTPTPNMVTPTLNMLTPPSDTVTSCMVTPDQMLVSTSGTQSASIDSSSGDKIKMPGSLKAPILNLAQSLKQKPCSADTVTNSDGTDILSVTGTTNLCHKNVDLVNASNSSHSKYVNTSSDTGIVNFGDTTSSISLRHKTISNILATRQTSHMILTVPPTGSVNNCPKGVCSSYGMPSQDRILNSSTYELENQKVIAERIPDITSVIDTSHLLINQDSPVKKITRHPGSFSHGHTTDWQRSQEQTTSIFVNAADVRNMSQSSTHLNGSQYSSDRSVLDLGKNTKRTDTLPVSTHYQTIASKGVDWVETSAAPNTVQCSVPYPQGQSYNQGQVLGHSVGQGHMLPALHQGQGQELSNQQIIQSNDGFKKPQISVNHPVSPTKYKTKHLNLSKPQASCEGKKQISLVKDNDGKSVSDLDDSFLVTAGNLIESESDAEFLTANMPDDSEFEEDLSQEDDDGDPQQLKLDKEKENKKILKKETRGRKKSDKPLKDKYYDCCQSVNKEAEKAAEEKTKKNLQDFLKKGGTSSRQTEVPPKRKYNFKEENLNEEPKYVNENQMFVFTSQSDIQLMLDNKDLRPTMLSQRRDGTMKLVNKVLKNKSVSTNVKEIRYCECSPDMIGEEIPVEQVFLSNAQLFRLPDANVICIGRLKFYSFFREDEFHIPVDNLFKNIGSKVSVIFLQAMKNWKSLVLHSLTPDEIQLLEQKIEFDVNNSYTDLISLKDIQDIGKHLLNIEPDDLTLKMLAFSIPCKKVLGSQVRCANCGLMKKAEGLHNNSYVPILLDGGKVKLDQEEEQSLIEASIGTVKIGEENFTAFEIEKNMYISVKQIVKHGILSLTQVQTNLSKIGYKPIPPPKEIELHIRCNLCFVENTLWIDFVTLRCIVCMDKMKNVTASNIAKGLYTYDPEYNLMCKEHWKDESLFEMDSRALEILNDSTTVKMKNHEMPFIISVGRKKRQNWLDYEVDSTTDWKEGSSQADLVKQNNDAEKCTESELIIQVEEVGSNVVITCRTDDSSGQRNKYLQASSTTIDAINEECKRALRPRKKKNSYVETFENVTECVSENEVDDPSSDKNYIPNLNGRSKSRGTRKDKKIVLETDDDDHFVTDIEKFYKKLNEGNIQTVLDATVDLQTEDEKAAHALQYIYDTEDKSNKLNDLGFSLGGNSLLSQAIQLSGITSSISEVASQSSTDGENMKHANVEASNKGANETDKDQQCEVSTTEIDAKLKTQKYMQSVICTAGKMGKSPVKNRQVTGSERTEQLDHNREKSIGGLGKPVKENSRSKDDAGESVKINQPEKENLGGNTVNKAHAVSVMNEKRNDSQLLCQMKERIYPQANLDGRSCAHIQTNTGEVLSAVADTAAVSKADGIARSNKHVDMIVPAEDTNNPGFATIDLNGSLHLLAAVATDSGITEDKNLSGRSNLIKSPHSLSINENNSEIAETYQESKKKRKRHPESYLINATDAGGLEKENERKLRKQDDKKKNETNTVLQLQEKSTKNVDSGYAQADNRISFVSRNEMEDLHQNQKDRVIQVPPEKDNLQTIPKLKEKKGKRKQVLKNKPFQPAKEKGKHKECEKEIENHQEVKIELNNDDTEVKYSEMMNTNHESDNSKLNSKNTAVSNEQKSQSNVDTEHISSRSELSDRDTEMINTSKNNDQKLANEMKVEQNEKVKQSQVSVNDNTPTSTESEHHKTDMTEEEQRKEMDDKIKKYIDFAYKKVGSQPVIVAKQFREGAKEAFPALFLPYPEHPETKHRRTEFMKAAGAYMNNVYKERRQQILNERSQKPAVQGNCDMKKDKEYITVGKVHGEVDAWKASSTKCPANPSQTRPEKCSQHVDNAVNPHDKSLHGKPKDKTETNNEHSKHILDRNGNVKATEIIVTEKFVSDNMNVKPVREKPSSTDKLDTNLCDSHEADKHPDSVRSDKYESPVMDKSKDHVIDKPALKNGQTCKEVSETPPDKVSEKLINPKTSCSNYENSFIQFVAGSKTLPSKPTNSGNHIISGSVEKNDVCKVVELHKSKEKSKVEESIYSENRLKGTDPVPSGKNTIKLSSKVENSFETIKKGHVQENKKMKRNLEELDSQEGTKRRKLRSASRVKNNDSVGELINTEDVNGLLKPNDDLDSDSVENVICFEPTKKTSKRGKDSSLEKTKQLGACDIVQTSQTDNDTCYKVTKSILGTKPLFECEIVQDSLNKRRFGKEKLNDYRVLKSILMSEPLFEWKSGEDSLKKRRFEKDKLNAGQGETRLATTVIKLEKDASEDPELEAVYDICDQTEIVDDIIPKIKNVKQKSETSVATNSENEISRVNLRASHQSEGHQQLNKCSQVEKNSVNEIPTIKIRSRHKSEGHQQLNKSWQVETNIENKIPTLKLRSRHKSEVCQPLNKSWQAELTYVLNESSPKKIKSEPNTEISCPQKLNIKIVQNVCVKSSHKSKRCVNSDVNVAGNKRGKARKTGEKLVENISRTRSLRGRRNVRNIESSLCTSATSCKDMKTKQVKTEPQENDITAGTDQKLVIDKNSDFDETRKSHQTLVKRLKRTDNDKWAIENAVCLPECFVVLKRLAVLEESVNLFNK